MAKSIRSASEEELVSTKESQAQPTETAQSDGAKAAVKKRKGHSSQDKPKERPQQPSNSKQAAKAKAKAKAKSQPGPKAKAKSQPCPKSKLAKRKQPATSAIGDDINRIIALFDQDDSQQASLELTRVLTSILETCQAECMQRGGTCSGYCHMFDLPLSDVFQLSVYWTRRAVGVKILKDDSDSDKKFHQVAYFGSGPCTFANWVLGRIWVTQLKFGN